MMICIPCNQHPLPILVMYHPPPWWDAEEGDGTIPQSYGVCDICRTLWRFTIFKPRHIMEFRFRHKIYDFQYVNSLGGYEVTFERKTVLHLWKWT